MPTYTTRLNLAKPAADDIDWKGMEDSNKDILDDNPGIAMVADAIERDALDVWEGRRCFQADEKAEYRYINAAWEPYELTAMAEVDNFGHEGDYSAIASYFKHNMVFYDAGTAEEEGTYICIDDNDGAGIVDVPPTNTTHWRFAFPSTAGPRGATPDHEWDGSSIRFQESDGSWGAWVDLEGPKGDDGADGTVEGVVGPKKSVTQETTASVGASGSATGSISFDCSSHTGAEAFLLMVNVNPDAAISGFKFQLFATQASRDAGTNPVYELDTAEDTEYTGGDPVRDPNAGYDTISYFIDDDAAAAAETGNLWYKVENLDTETASAFVIDIDYKGIV